MLMAKIYYCDISNCIITNDYKGISADRYNYIVRLKDKERKLQSYFSSKLLEFALNEVGVDFSCGFSENNGEWSLISNEILFSISHSNNLVVIALSSDNIGVDVEKFDKKVLLLEKKYSPSIKLNKNEEKIEYYLKMWTKREANFKSKNRGKDNYFVLEDSNSKYMLCVTTNEDIEFIKKVKI